MPSAEIITIGTEILLGEIIDTNATYIARELRRIGMDLYRKTSVGDNAERIAQAIREALQRCDVVITTGGLGPTVDDPTREAVALAFDVQTEFRPELWEQIQARFARFGRQPTENNKRQAYIPQGAHPIENPVGTAPCFRMEGENGMVISLPGVPREMEHLMQNAVLPHLRERYPNLGVIKARVLHTAGAGESNIDALIGDLEELTNPTVGLAAHSGQVDVRITAKAGSEAEADALIEPVEAEVRARLGIWVYGADEETLEQTALQALRKQNWRVAVVESGLGGRLVRRLGGEESADAFAGGELLTQSPDNTELRQLTEAYRHSRGAEIGLGVVLRPGKEKQDIFIILLTPQGEQQLARPYGGPPKMAVQWAVNHALNLLRKL
ncbi:MAG: CinA family nicotinamide mononucleotide deamidase-related protein [Anaerolineae bacterium]|nr:MAG: CinA family nicotinamide mononucleotide deamidase-related protein [Anaerolineae bacterium]